MDMMVSRDQAARNRDIVVDAASRLFRIHGVDGIGIGDVMREVGLTHGGFYKQFESKDALAAEACDLSLAQGAQRWREVAARSSGSAVDAIAVDYLSMRNRDFPERGCSLIALGADAARKGGALADAYRNGVEEFVLIFEEAGVSRSEALARLSTMVGAMLLARGVKDAALSKEIMAAAAESLVA